ncbi:unnamed protein product [Lymnaea stagnalis]|uniref:Uncharacterized protein n=1 Tax=Lymnaea stagnalis TaxID=6523 RepID=A0AAV2H8A9_LYMST
MHSMSLWGFLTISCLTVTTVLCQDVVANCYERIEECKKVAFEEEDEVKRNEELTNCFGGFKCEPEADSERENLKEGASARVEANKINRRRWSTGIAPTSKANHKFVAASLVTVLGAAHF